MHITEEIPEKFVSKKGAFMSSELVCVPPLIKSSEYEERSDLYTKTKEEKKALKKIKLNVDVEAAKKSVIEYAKKNKLDSPNFRIKFV